MADIGIYKTTLFRKIVMSFTGLFIAFFLIIHLAGNLQLLLPPETAHEQYNWYSHLLSHNILIEIIAIVLYISLLTHVIDSIYITLQNRKASGPALKKDTRGKVSPWYSRNMFILGLVIFIFLVVHMKDYWFQYKFGFIPMDAQGNKDIYTIVVESFSHLWYVILYVVGFIGLGYHLAHGVSSAFRTLGLYSKSYINIFKYLGYAFAILLPLGYAIVAVVLYLQNM